MKTKLHSALLIIFLLTTGTFNLIAQQERPSGPSPFYLNNSDIRLSLEMSVTKKSSVLLPVYDSIYNYGWDTITANWKLRHKSTKIIYNSNNNMINQTLLFWNGTTWMDSVLYTYSFDANNNQLTSLEQRKRNNNWVNEWKYTNSYDSNNNKKTVVLENWDGATWGNTLRYFSEYDVTKNYISDKGQLWDGATWVNLDTNFYTYDANNNWTSHLSQYWNGSKWVNNGLDNTTIYNSQNKLMSFTSNLWNGSLWMVSDKQSYAYDANGNRIRILKQYWNGTGWIDSAEDSIVYDADNFVTDHFEKFQNKDSNKIMFGTHVHYFFHAINVGISDLNISKENMIIYPNPSNSGVFTIRQQNHIAEIKIYNVIGEQIYSTPVTDLETRIDLSKQVKGIYFMQLIYGDKNATTKKIVIE